MRDFSDGKSLIGFNTIIGEIESVTESSVVEIFISSTPRALSIGNPLDVNDAGVESS